MIPADEHDAHELLHILLSSLEEEAIQPKKIGCLSDALSKSDGNELLPTMPPPRPSSAMLSDFSNPDYDESTNFMRQVRSEAHTPDSPHSVCTDLDDSTMSENSQLHNPTIMLASTMSPSNGRQSRSRVIQHTGNGIVSTNEGAAGDNLNKRNSMSCRSLERLNRGPGRISIWSEKAQIQIPHPFRGAQSSQLICSGCGYKSVVRYDKFDSVTLTLPQIKKQGLCLGNLLTEYIASEDLSDVTCESCKETTNHTKSLTFAKVCEYY